ncbi:antimicrobial peptide NK-lysin-like protein [Labeo rohita]|uniref:Antimicrobial peptide NK-lysin-like protein n=1 Tax=Labeo rohita TaxID=84645 RepID=A0A498MQL4_LABRO|nr:antimicrobial peptide NK-lysin-like protein [Labeo rohita]
MLRNIFLVSLLVYAVCAAHWEIREVDSAEDQNEDMCADDMMKEQKVLCSACKTIIKMVKEKIPSNATPEDIKTKLNNICEKMKLLKRKCMDLVQKHLHGLIDELMTDDGPKAICTKIHVCK